MFEKQKKVFKEKVEKGIELTKKDKAAISFGLGMATMVGLHLIAEKIDEPKSGAITYEKRLDGDGIEARVFYKNRFGKEKNPLNIRYDENGGHLKELTDNLNEIMYPGD